MAIIVGDIHGNAEKVRAFLAYKPETEHIALGDYLDSFLEPQILQILALQLQLDSPAVLLWGNHDLHYLRTPPWLSTGFQHGKEEPLIQLVEAHKHRFLAAYAVDGWLCTHVGVHVRVSRPKRCRGNVDLLAEKLNADMMKYLQKPETYQRLNYIAPSPSIFNIGQGRGGNSNFPGIFWFDFRRELGLDTSFKQIFGHTEGKTAIYGDPNYICLDTTNNSTECWLFDTETGGLFCLPIKRQCDFLRQNGGTWT
jgi:hypothetical protein